MYFRWFFLKNKPLKNQHNKKAILKDQGIDSMDHTRQMNGNLGLRKNLGLSHIFEQKFFFSTKFRPNDLKFSI